MNAPNPRDYKVPPGWGDDPLSHFQWTGMQNELSTFVHAPSWQELLSAIAGDLLKCSAYAIANVPKSDEPSPQLLFMTAHNHFLASARLVSSGQCLSAYPTGRAAVESALYGWYLAGDSSACQRWHDKPADRSKLKAWSNEFKFSNLTSVLSRISTGAADWAKYLHQTAIDFGAHPNKEALYSNLLIEKHEGRVLLQMAFLHKWQASSIGATKFVIETGMFVIGLFGRAFPDADEAHELLAAASRHAAALSTLVSETAQFVKDDVERANNGV